VYLLIGYCGLAVLLVASVVNRVYAGTCV